MYLCCTQIVTVSLESFKWPLYITLCGGEHQSPINIDPLLAVVVDYPQLVFGNYDKVFSEAVTNNGHTGKPRSLLKHLYN